MLSIYLQIIKLTKIIDFLLLCNFGEELYGSSTCHIGQTVRKQIV